MYETRERAPELLLHPPITEAAPNITTTPDILTPRTRAVALDEPPSAHPTILPTIRHQALATDEPRPRIDIPTEHPTAAPTSRQHPPLSTWDAQPSTPSTSAQHDYEPDVLDQLIQRASELFGKADSWTQFASECTEGRGDFHPAVGSIPHPAAPFLSYIREHGVPVLMLTPPWSKGRLKAALSRGPHKSAKENIQFLREEFAAMIQKGQWVILPARLLEDEEELRLSPLGVVPQRDRRPRTICDYTYFAVNADTFEWAPQSAMQFGKALPRILWRIHHSNPRHGPVHIAKIDLSDGFYRVPLQPEDMMKLAVLFPSRPGEEPLIGLPLTLPMGWKESPPGFCSATETVADIANANIRARHIPLPHRFDEVSEPTSSDGRAPITMTTTASAYTGPPAPLGAPHNDEVKKPLSYWDIYVDDFIGLVQGNRWKRRRTKRILFHALDSVFRPVDPDDNTH